MTESPASRPAPSREARAEAERAHQAFFAMASLNFIQRKNGKPQKTAKDYSTDWLTIVGGSSIFNHMVEQRLDATFRALADPTRRGMLANLALGEKSIGALAEPFAMSFAGAAKHVKVLEEAGLVARRKAGRAQICSLRAAPMAEADAWLKQWEKFWNVRLDRLEALIAADKQEKSE